MSTTINASQLMMQQMGQMKQQVSSGEMSGINNIALPKQENDPSNENTVNFSDLLGNAIKQVNGIQQTSGKLKKDFEMGKDGVSLVEVMVAGEKASVAFTALLQTRNKLLRAYTQILNTRV